MLSPADVPGMAKPLEPGQEQKGKDSSRWRDSSSASEWSERD